MSNPSCYYPPYVFPCYETVRLCWTSSNGTEPTHQSPSIMHSHPFNVMSPCICIMHHCMLYHATCIMNATWTIQTIQFTMSYGQLYYEHIICKPTIISMSIYSNTYNNIQSPQSMSSKTQEMTTLIHKTNCGIDMPTKNSTQWPQGKP